VTRAEAWVVSGLALGLLLAPAAAAEIRRMEAVGAFPLAPDVRQESSPREAAERIALNEAVRRVALDLVVGMSPEEAAEYLPEVLGDVPFDYTARYRVIEDRGERPALFTSDPTVEFEYVVVVEAHIDSKRVERRLQAAGLAVARESSQPERDLRLVIDDLASYAAYAALRKALIEGVGATTAIPAAMERGRAELVVTTDASPPQLLEDLLRAAPPELVITPVSVDEAVLTVRIELDELAVTEPAPAGGGGPVPRN
jgi:hypothetical protein